MAAVSTQLPKPKGIATTAFGLLQHRHGAAYTGAQHGCQQTGVVKECEGTSPVTPCNWDTGNCITNIYIYTYMHICNVYLHTCVHIYMCIYTYIYMYICIYIYMIGIYTYTYTHICVYVGVYEYIDRSVFQSSMGCLWAHPPGPGLRPVCFGPGGRQGAAGTRMPGPARSCGSVRFGVGRREGGWMVLPP